MENISVKSEQISMVFIQEKASENVIWKMAAILYWSQWVNHHCFGVMDD